ncbi:MAG: nuclear transport factor 2 family protein [Planctomycetota bacterium]
MSAETESAICEDTIAVGKKLVELCNAGKDEEVLDTYYAEDIVSEEVATMPGTGLPRVSQGIEAVRAKWQWWYDNHEVHGSKCTGPFPHGNKFIVIFEMDTTAKSGPMAGQRMQMQETALYTVENGKIVHEQFFYDMGGC